MEFLKIINICVESRKLHLFNVYYGVACSVLLNTNANCMVNKEGGFCEYVFYNLQMNFSYIPRPWEKSTTMFSFSHGHIFGF